MEPNMTFVFNAQEYDPAGSFEPIPEGMYMAMVKTAEIKPTKNATTLPDGTPSGLMLTCQFEILDQEYKGRVFFDRFNIKNESPQAQTIGQKQLSALCYATGVIRITDPRMLIGIPVMVRLAIKPAEGQYQASNIVREYRTQHGVKPQDIHSGKAINTPVGAPAQAPVMQAANYATPTAQPAAQSPTTFPSTFATPVDQAGQATQFGMQQATQGQPAQTKSFTPPTFVPPSSAQPAFTPPSSMAPKE